MTDRKKTLVVYHGHCTDGFTAAWAAWLKFGDEAEYVAANREPGENFDVDGRDVYILDYCPSRDALVDYKKRARTLKVMDHHKTSEALCTGLSYCLFDTHRSGAGMAWDYFHSSKPRPKLVTYVEDRDIWTWELPYSKQISEFIMAYDNLTSFEKWSELSTYLENDFDYAAKAGAAILRSKDVDIGNFQRHTLYTTFAGYPNVPVVNASGIIVSELLHRLATKDFFAVSWYLMEEDKFKYSLRSNGDFDVALLAERLGGGGHKNAAAFMSSHPPWELREQVRSLPDLRSER